MACAWICLLPQQLCLTLQRLWISKPTTSSKFRANFTAKAAVFCHASPTPSFHRA
jgi:hypothetical protein